MVQWKFMKKNWMHYKYIGMKKFLIIIITGAFAILMLQSCKKASGDFPGTSYTNDMMYSRAYETYGPNHLLKDSMGAMLPVEGTVPFSGDPHTGEYDSTIAAISLPYEYSNSIEDYERSAMNPNPVAASAENIAHGKIIFDIYCAVCHGVAGNGQGNIVTSGKYKAAPPNYFDSLYMVMPDGKMYHSITYGKNAMGSYAYAVSKEDRWKVIQYINKLQNDYALANGIAIPTATAEVTNE